MKLLKNAAQSAMPGPSEQFTGQVWNEVLAVGDAPGFVHVARVIFTPAARAAWHTHPLGQILVAVSGLGLAQKAGEPLLVLHPGDSVSSRRDAGRPAGDLARSSHR